MPEFDVISVVFFRKSKGKYFFYITKIGSTFPIMPSCWIPISGVVLPKDRELFSHLQALHGEISPNMLQRLTALRIVFQRNLVRIDDLIDQSTQTDVFELIANVDQEQLNVWLHSMFPFGYDQLISGQHKFNIHYVLFITPANPTLFRMKLKRTSDIFTSSDILFEAQAKWIESKKLLRNYQRLKQLYTPTHISLVEKLQYEYKSLIDSAREIDQNKEQKIIDSHRIFPYIWRFTTPAPDEPPYDTTNIYVVGNEHKYIIDPGSTDSKALSDLRLFIEKNIETIDGILLTNRNPDHCNQALSLKDDFDLPMSTSAITAKYLKSEGFIFGSKIKEGTKISLGSYEPLKIENWQMETIELPGSTKGSIGFWDPRRVLFSGIALHKDLTTSTYKYPESCSDLLNSINRIKKYHVKFILSAHGAIITDKSKTISETIERIKIVEKFVIEQLKKGVTTSDELTDLFIMEHSPKWKTYAKSLILSNIEKLVVEEKVSKISDDYIWKKKSKNS